ncbi:MAG: translocation/assembly module TamB domain-containing protein [Bacteriovoracaceae bacterium]
MGKYLNKYIISFLFVFAIASYAALEFSRSKVVASFITKRINGYLSKQKNIKIYFEKIDIHPLTLSASVRNVSIETNELRGLTSDVNVKIKLFSLLRNKIAIDRIHVKNGEFFIHDFSFEKKGEKENENYKDYGSEIRKSLNLMKLKVFNSEYSDIVNELYIENSRIDFKDEQFLIDTIEITKNSKFASARVAFNVPTQKKIFAHDKIEMELTLSQTKFQVNSFKITDGFFSLMGEVSVLIAKDFQSKMVGSVDFKIPLDKISDFYPVEARGLAKGEIHLGGTLEGPHMRLNLDARNMGNEYIRFQRLNSNLAFRNQKISVEDIYIQNEDASVKLLKPFNIFDLKDSKILNFKALTQIEKYHTNDLLFSIDDILSGLKGKVSGKLLVDSRKSFNSTRFIGQKGMKLKDVEYFPVEDKLLGLKEVNLNLLNVHLDWPKDSVTIELKAKKQNQMIDVKGVVDNDNLRFDVFFKNFDFDRFKNISTVPFGGNGDLGITISGLEKTVFDFDMKAEELQILGLSFGESIGRMILTLDDLNLKVQNIKAKKNVSSYVIDGKVNFEKSEIDLDINHKNNRFEDIIEIMGVHFPKELNSLREIKMYSDVQYNVSGGFAFDKLKITGKLKSDKATYYGEEFKKPQMNFSLNNEVISLKRFSVNAFSGKIKGGLDYSIPRENLDYRMQLFQGRFEDVRFLKKGFPGVNSSFEIKASGSYGTSKQKGEVVLNLNRMQIGNSFFNKNQLDFSYNHSSMIWGVDFLDSQVLGASQYIFGGRKEKGAILDINFDINNGNDLFAAVKPEIIQNVDQMDTMFKGHLLLDVNFERKLMNKLSLGLDDFKVFYKGNRLAASKNSGFLIEKNKILKRKIQFDTNRKYKAEASIAAVDGLDLILKSKFLLPTNLAELFVPNVDYINGEISGEVEGKAGETLEFNSGMLELSNGGFKPKDIPVSVEKISGRLRLDKQRVEFYDFKGILGKGNLAAHGQIDFSNIIPSVDIKYNVQNAIVSPFENTRVLFSSAGNLLGDQPPYDLKGKILLFHGTVHEEFDKLTSREGEKNVTSKFAPEKKFQEGIRFLNAGFDVEILESVHVRNSIVDIHLEGESKIKGPMDSMNFLGSFNIDKEKENKILVKGNSFLVSRGAFQLTDSTEGVTIDLEANSKVKDYDIQLNVQGEEDDIKITLKSTPTLSKEDIFSLLTLGVTSESSRELKEDQKSSIATIGIGSIIFDQLKIGQGLNNSLGLRMSISPELQSDADSTLLEGKSAVASSKRVKTATKIKIEKSFSDNVDLSLSNTVGGSSQQKQEMNLIYKVNENVSLDGVLEVKDVDEESSSESPESVGWDLKYKWSF